MPLPPKPALTLIALSLLYALTTPTLAAVGSDFWTHIDRAEAFEAEGEVRAAIIELKNAARLAPEDGDVRARLGRLYLRSGQYAAAEKALKRATELGIPTGQLGLAPARALAGQGKLDALLAMLSNPDTLPLKDRAAGWRLRAEALLSTDRDDDARQAFEQAIQTAPDDTAARLGLARLALRQDDLDAAYAALREAIDSDPDDVRPWAMLGRIELRRGRRPQALSAYRHAIELAPQSGQLRLQRAIIHLDDGQLAAAEADLSAARQQLGDSPRMLTVEGMLALARKRYQQAGALFAKALQRRPGDAQARYLLASTQLHSGEQEQAISNLRRVTREHPDALFAQRLYAIVLLRASSIGIGTTLAERVLKTSPNDPELLQALVTALTSDGQQPRAAPYQQRLDALNKADKGLIDANRALRAGELQAAVAELESLAHSATPLGRADYLLVRTQLRQGNAPGALSAARRLVNKRPDDPEAVFLLGLALRVSGDSQAAVDAFERVITLAPGAPRPHHQLARLALATGHIEPARRHYQQALATNPGHLATLLALARLANDDQQRLSYLSEALRFHPDALRIRARLARLQLRLGDPAAALALVKPRPADDTNRRFQRLRWRIALRAGDLAEATAAAQRLIALDKDQDSPNAAADWLRLAEARGKAGDQQGLSTALQAALTATGPLATERLLALAALAGDGRDQVIATLAKQRPDDPRVIDLQGLAELQDGHAEAALQRYQRERQKQPKQAVWWLREARALAALRRASQRLVLLIQASRAVPEDTALRLALAQAWVTAGRLSEARVAYQRVLKQTPAQALALQQLASLWLADDPDKALDYARRALKARPSADNYYKLGIMLLRADQPAPAAIALRGSLSRRPAHANSAYHLALALSRTGHAEQAQAILTPLLQRQQTFDMRSAAEKLLARLQAQ